VSGPLFGEALTVLFVTCRALAYWIAAAAFAATVVCVVGVAGAAWAIRRAWRGLAGPQADEQAPKVAESIPTPTKPTAPSWARADKEAA
jgi:hypothetical protein